MPPRRRTWKTALEIGIGDALEKIMQSGVVALLNYQIAVNNLKTHYDGVKKGVQGARKKYYTWRQKVLETKDTWDQYKDIVTGRLRKIGEQIDAIQNDIIQLKAEKATLKVTKRELKGEKVQLTDQVPSELLALLSPGQLAKVQSTLGDSPKSPSPKKKSKPKKKRKILKVFRRKKSKKTG